MSVKTKDLGMTPLDDLFSTDESRAESQFEKVVTLNHTEIFWELWKLDHMEFHFIGIDGMSFFP